MRTSATIIGIFAFLLTGCGFAPQIRPSDKAAMEALKGPDITSMDSTLKAQAEQAEQMGDYNGAAETYKQLIDKSPDNKEFMLAFADDVRRAGNSDAALVFEEKLLKKDPNNAAALEGKGLCQMNKGNFTDAGKTFEKVMQIDAKRWRTLNGIGILFVIKGKDDDAIAYYNEALTLSVDNASVLNNLALTLAMEKKYSDAFDAFNRAKHHLPSGSPEIASIDLNMALVYAITGKLEEAQQLAAPHLSKSALYNNMGFYAYLAKNTDLAKGYLNMALTQSPVYYERAWKNLNALASQGSEETDESTPASAKALTAPAPMPAPDEAATEKKLTRAEARAKAKAKAAKEAKAKADKAKNVDLSTKLDDIPAQKPAVIDLTGTDPSKGIDVATPSTPAAQPKSN